MPDEKKKGPKDDIESILSGLDAIFKDKEDNAQTEPKPEAMPPLSLIPPPEPQPAPPSAPQPAPPPASQPAPPLAPQPAPPSARVDSLNASQIELAPREGIIKPLEKKPDTSKPAAALTPPKLEPASVKQPIPVVATAPTSVKIEEFAADTPKEQIRRVAYIHTAACAEMKMAFAAFLSQSARTISKKPLYLREVLSQEIGAASDPNAVLKKALQMKAVAILAISEGLSSAKVDELSGACHRANLSFRAVAPADTQKKSTAVDIIVDLMLLPGEA